jgi:hypothetical protein
MPDHQHVVLHRVEQVRPVAPKRLADHETKEATPIIVNGRFLGWSVWNGRECLSLWSERLRPRA